MHNKKVAIIGAGLAGCSIAYELSKLNTFKISIFDKNSKIANAASGNFAGILAPYLAGDKNYSEQFYTFGYKLLLDFINKYKDKIEIYNQGILQILSDKKQQQRYYKIFNKRNISIELASLLNQSQVSDLLNMDIGTSAVHYPNALSLMPKSVCKLWVKISQANLNLNSELKHISKVSNEKWHLEFTNFADSYDIVIFAGGYDLFDKVYFLSKIPVYSSQGQLTLIKKWLNIDTTIIDKGYIIPNYKQKFQIVGATFRENKDTTGEIRELDDLHNLSQIKEMLPSLIKNDADIIGSMVATRCVTSDHLPLVGKLVDYDKFKSDFYKPFLKGYPKSLMLKVNYEKGLYLSSGFGSKGLSSSLIAAKIIAAQIINQQNIISDKLLDALSPQRFWIRNFKRGICV